MPAGEVRRAKVPYIVEVTGEMEVEYEVGVETPDQVFTRLYAQASIADLYLHSTWFDANVRPVKGAVVAS